MQKIIKISTNIWPELGPGFDYYNRGRPAVYELAARPTKPTDVVEITQTDAGFAIRHHDSALDFEVLAHAVQQVWRRDEDAEKNARIKKLIEESRTVETNLVHLRERWQSVRDQIQPGGTHESLLETSRDIKAHETKLAKIMSELETLGVPPQKTEVPEKAEPKIPPQSILFDKPAYNMSGVEEIHFATNRFQELIGQALTNQDSGVLTQLTFEEGKVVAMFSYKTQ